MVGHGAEAVNAVNAHHRLRHSSGFFIEPLIAQKGMGPVQAVLWMCLHTMCVLVLTGARLLRCQCCGQAETQLQEHTFRLVPSANKLPGHIRQLRVAQHCCHGIALLPRYC